MLGPAYFGAMLSGIACRPLYILLIRFTEPVLNPRFKAAARPCCLHLRRLAFRDFANSCKPHMNHAAF